MTTHKVTIDGIEYFAQTPMEAEVKGILREVYGALWAEAYYDAFNDSTKKFAQPLSDKMRRLNELLKFKE